ncbi:MAG: radical SAM protein [bacterium]
MSPAAKPWVLLLAPGSAVTTSPPLGLLSLAASLERAGFDARVSEPAVDGSRVEELLASKPLLCGISARTSSFPELVDCVALLRRLVPEVPIVIGGVHVSALPEEALRESGADLAVRGEGEEALVEIAQRLAQGEPVPALADIPRILVRGGDEIRLGPEPVAPLDLNALPPPAWHHVDFDRYSARPWQLVRRGRRVAPIMTSRGCPFRCVFCATHIVCGRKLRVRDPEAVADEVELLVRTHGVDEIQIADDNFNASEDHAAAVCEALLRRGLRVPWKTPNGVRVDRLSDELLRLMVASGCYSLGFGIESGDPRILENARKKLDLGVASENIARAARLGISCFGYFVVGLPGDTLKSVRLSIRFAQHNALDHVHVAPMVPYPGSEIYDQLPADHALRSWSSYTHLTAFDTPTLSAAQIRRAVREFYLRFYAHPRRGVGLIWALRHAPWRTVAAVARGYLGPAGQR